jgi:hypothetical protein
MSAIKVDTQNISILGSEVVTGLADNKQYESYSEEAVEKIALDVVDNYKKILLSQKPQKEVVFDDEELFDEVYDKMLKKLSEVFSTADIASIVNDVFMRIEDLLFDEGLIEYSE